MTQPNSALMSESGNFRAFQALTDYGDYNVTMLQSLSLSTYPLAALDRKAPPRNPRTANKIPLTPKAPKP